MSREIHRRVNELLTIKRVSYLCEFSTDGRMVDLCPSQVNVFADLSRASRTCDQNVACTSACTRAGEQEGREQFRGTTMAMNRSSNLIGLCT